MRFALIERIAHPHWHRLGGLKGAGLQALSLSKHPWYAVPGTFILAHQDGRDYVAGMPHFAFTHGDWRTGLYRIFKMLRITRGIQRCLQTLETIQLSSPPYPWEGTPFQFA